MSKSYAHLLPPSWKPQVTAWLAEDTPSFDYGGYVVGEAVREAYLFGKGKVPAVLAGSPFFTEVFTQLGCEYATRRSSVSRETYCLQGRMARRRGRVL
jgi:nicotinate-nucleotide pyrophosphorylase (carboxylating)